MAKIPSDKLHRLIRSLTSAEKRYFTIFIRGKTDRDSKYIQLFELLSDTAAYNSEKVQKAIYGKQAPDSKKYPELKAYLYDLLLKSLESYDEQHSVENKLAHLLRSVASLFKRGYYSDCELLLAKALKIATQYELFTQHLEVIKWTRHLAYTRMDIQFLHKQLDLIDFEEGQVLEKLNNLTAYRRTFFRMYALIKKDAFQRDANRLESLQTMIPEALFKTPDCALSIRGLILYYRTINLYHYAAQDLENFYTTGQQLIQLIENQSFFLEENLSEYIASLSNYILSCGLREQHDEVRNALRKLRDLTPKTEDDRRKIHRQYYSTMFLLCQFTGEFEEAQLELARCKAEAEILHSKDYETFSFLFQYFYISFGCGDFEEALDYLNQWLAQPRSVEREDLQSLARILSLILHFELGNYILLDSLIRSTKRFLRQKNRLYELEKEFIQLMSDLMRAPSQEDSRRHLAGFEKNWGNIPGTSAINQIFDLKAWIDSKIHKKTFGEIIRERTKQKSKTG